MDEDHQIADDSDPEDDPDDADEAEDKANYASADLSLHISDELIDQIRNASVDIARLSFALLIH